MSDLASEIIEDKVYELNIGKSFQNTAKITYHQFKYDFTPASIDRNQEARVSIGTKNDVMIQVPHIDGSTQKYTQFTGNKQPSTTKECILIYDTRTNEFTLERLQTNFILKRSRLEGSSKAQIITPRSITPTNENNVKKKKQEMPPTPISQLNKKSSTQSTSRLPKEASSSPPLAKSLNLKNENLFGDDLNLSDDGSDFNDSNM